MKSLTLLALLPALTCAFFLPIPPLFNNQLLNSSHVSLVSLVSHDDSNTSQVEVRDHNMTDADFKEICTIVHFAQSEFCGNTSSLTHHELHVPPEFCSLLSVMNQTFCQDETREKGEKREKHGNKSETLTSTHKRSISETNEDIYEKFYSEVYIENSEEIKNNTTNLDPKDLCPIFDLVDKTFCTSLENKLNPKDLCPILEFVEKELCVSA
jgi:hypothetical protein